MLLKRVGQVAFEQMTNHDVFIASHTNHVNDSQSATYEIKFLIIQNMISLH